MVSIGFEKSGKDWLSRSCFVRNVAKWCVMNVGKRTKEAYEAHVGTQALVP